MLIRASTSLSSVLEEYTRPTLQIQSKHVCARTSTHMPSAERIRLKSDVGAAILCHHMVVVHRSEKLRKILSLSFNRSGSRTVTFG